MRVAGYSDFILVNETQLQAFRLPIGDDIVFGRSSKLTDIQLLHDSIGRRHGRFHVKGDSLEVIDHGATTGIFVNGGYVQRAVLQVDDELQIGALKCRVRPISWLGDGPPFSGDLDHDEAHARMVRAFVHAASPAPTPDERDEIWWSLYAHWWRTNADERLFQDAWRLWTPTVLRRIRVGLDDPARWFLGHGKSAFEALIANHGLGELLGFDLLMCTRNDDQRQHAELALSNRARACRQSLVGYMLTRLDAAMDEAPRLLGHILHRAMQDRAPFKLERIRKLASDPRLGETVAAVVFVTFDRPQPLTFRLDAGEILTLDGTGLLDDVERLRVARPEDLDPAWGDELANHHIVQPFPQL